MIATHSLSGTCNEVPESFACSSVKSFRILPSSPTSCAEPRWSRTKRSCSRLSVKIRPLRSLRILVLLLAAHQKTRPPARHRPHPPPAPPLPHRLRSPPAHRHRQKRSVECLFASIGGRCAGTRRAPPSNAGHREFTLPLLRSPVVAAHALSARRHGTTERRKKTPRLALYRI